MSIVAADAAGAAAATATAAPSTTVSAAASRRHGRRGTSGRALIVHSSHRDFSSGTKMGALTFMDWILPEGFGVFQFLDRATNAARTA
ncbi:hypothetical protein Apa02nite_035160 [Actinoplanes palleronii]|uniref:Uncharacterized protein n=1 Tax=Actinoplanes palleronii TaxID=113570 RepID=A0ABQ4B9R0_9ACTN|nr:hypothetical protein Apa02nite_035160 [Actinoplanes palleronii]